MARHSQADGRTVYTVVTIDPSNRGAHRVETDRVPLGYRASAIAVAVGVAAGTATLAHATSTKGLPMAGAMGLTAFADEAPASTGAVRTVHAVNPGPETARLLKFETLYAAQNVNQATKVAQDGYAARKQAAAEQAAREAEARKPAKQREIEGWIREAIGILAANGTPVTQDSLDEIYTIIIKESNGNPNAINNWDSNAAKGTPSKGLMQCIDPTFQRYKLAGHNNIYNPVDNIIAGVRYTYARYGGFDRHPGLVSINLGGGYKGY